MSIGETILAVIGIMLLVTVFACLLLKGGNQDRDD